MKIISSQYYFVKEENKLVVFNVKEHRPEKIINIHIDLLDRIIELNNLEVQVSKEPVYSKLMENLSSILPFIMVDVTESDFNNNMRIESFIDSYIEVQQSHYNLRSHMLKINLRNCIYYKKYYVYIDTRGFELPTFQNIEIYDEFQEDPNALHIIDQAFFNAQKKSEIEAYAVKNGVQRLYFSEHRDSVILGPGLVGKDYGCLFCNDLQSAAQKSSSQVQQLVSAILQFELLHYDKNMLSFSTDDNTVCKGKYFKINKLNFSGEDFYLNRKSECQICGGIT